MNEASNLVVNEWPSVGGPFRALIEWHETRFPGACARLRAAVEEGRIHPNCAALSMAGFDRDTGCAIAHLWGERRVMGYPERVSQHYAMVQAEFGAETMRCLSRWDDAASNDYCRIRQRLEVARAWMLEIIAEAEAGQAPRT